ncbi:phosphinothricin acetyltransferase [Actinorhabdospora filicis]|uniref:Phosphinothricin acetyltransferase n=1 Tax=Actinorhabdospora filicis TaxID=1785913 RepID=A0A9W6SHS9_9ACTN|nr:GNAT family N-acetyltransferase [Actinorhabdospora filicis]GLZ76197.1 phosphinothricin acetyltransferase [Actinorhabdospora filicis]
MTDFEIRTATEDYDPQMVAVFREAFPALVINTGSLAHSRATVGGYGALIAFRDGEAVGVGTTGYPAWSAQREGSISLGVLPDARRAGIGSALLERLVAHHRADGGGAMRAAVRNAEFLAWAEKRGWRPGRTSRVSRCELSELPPAPDVPADVRIVPLSEVADLRAVHTADALATSDIPGNPVGPIPFEGWRDFLLTDPRMDTGLSLVAYIGEDVAAMTYIHRAGERVNSAFTGTHPGHRGRGLATLLKALALHGAAGAGATVAFTNNDSKNAPMLAVNTRLGYRPFVEMTTVQLD